MGLFASSLCLAVHLHISEFQNQRNAASIQEPKDRQGHFFILYFVQFNFRRIFTYWNTLKLVVLYDFCAGGALRIDISVRERDLESMAKGNLSLSV